MTSSKEILSWLIVLVVVSLHSHTLVGYVVEIGLGLVESGGCGKQECAECGERTETHKTSV